MPCHDGREDDDRERAKRHADAMAALLCGLMNGQADAVDLARAWCRYHARVDELRKTVKYDFQNAEIEMYLNLCADLLDRTFEHLCK